MFRTKVIKKIETRVLFSAAFSYSVAFLEIMWENMVEPNRPRMTI